MKEQRIPLTWNQKKDRLKERYSILSEDDLIYTKGKEDELIDRLRQKLDKSREEVKQIIKSM